MHAPCAFALTFCPSTSGEDDEHEVKMAIALESAFRNKRCLKFGPPHSFSPRHHDCKDAVFQEV